MNLWLLLMKLMIIPLFKLFLLIMIVLPIAVQAKDRAWPIITFTCDKSKNEVKLKNEVKWGDAGKNYSFDATQGTYSPWDLVRIKDSGERRLVSERSPLKLKCELNGDEYRFVVRPKIFNINFNGICGDRLSVQVTVYKNHFILIENKPMEKFCHGNSPVLRGIKVKAANGKVQLYEVSRSRFY